MGIKLSDYPDLQRAVEKQLAKDKGDQPELPKVMWLARVPALGIKPIKSRNLEVFLNTVNALQDMYPKLKIYIFEIRGM